VDAATQSTIAHCTDVANQGRNPLPRKLVGLVLEVLVLVMVVVVCVLEVETVVVVVDVSVVVGQ